MLKNDFEIIFPLKISKKKKQIEKFYFRNFHSALPKLSNPSSSLIENSKPNNLRSIVSEVLFPSVTECFSGLNFKPRM